VSDAGASDAGASGAGAIGLTRARLVGGLAIAAAFAALATLAALALDVDAAGHLGLVDLGALGGAGDAAFVFVTYRLPRVLAALLVGAALAGAGTTFQAVLQNPMAEPYTLGISSGSALAAVIAIRLGLGATLGTGAIGLSAMAGAGLTIALVWRLARVGDGLPAATLLLSGIAIAMFAAAASMLVQYTADLGEVYQMVRWMMGGLDVLGGPLARVAPFVALGLVVLLGQARAFNALAAGPDAAASVGVDPRRAVLVGFVAASLLVGATIALAGPIGFVGLMVPHATRALLGSDHRVLLPASMLAGGGFLVVCDAIGRIVLLPGELPVGVVTALVGAPFFLHLLAREKRSSRLWG
jgi:iron complex transport system permease protein